MSEAHTCGIAVKTRRDLCIRACVRTTLQRRFVCLSLDINRQQRDGMSMCVCVVYAFTFTKIERAQQRAHFFHFQTANLSVCMFDVHPHWSVDGAVSN